MAAENEVKNFRYNTMPLLGSWEKPPAAVADRDNEEVPTLLSDTGRKSLFLAAMKKTSEVRTCGSRSDGPGTMRPLNPPVLPMN